MPKDNAANNLLVDKRVVDRNIRKGLLTRDEFEKHLGALPDVAEQAESIQARLGEEDLDDEEDDDEGDEDDESDTEA